MSSLDTFQERFDNLNKGQTWSHLFALVDDIKSDMQSTPLKKAILDVSDAAVELGGVGNSGEFYDADDDWEAHVHWIGAVLNLRQMLRGIQG